MSCLLLAFTHQKTFWYIITNDCLGTQSRAMCLTVIDGEGLQLLPANLSNHTICLGPWSSFHQLTGKMVQRELNFLHHLDFNPE